VGVLEEKQRVLSSSRRIGQFDALGAAVPPPTRGPVLEFSAGRTHLRGPLEIGAGRRICQLRGPFGWVLGLDGR
jgi:hypothetical protein